MIGNKKEMFQYSLLERRVSSIKEWNLKWGIFPFSIEIGIIVTYFYGNIAKTEGGEGSEKPVYKIVRETNINKRGYTRTHTLPYLS